MNANVVVRDEKQITLRNAHEAIEIYKKFDFRKPGGREICEKLVDAFERLASTPPIEIIVQEVTKFLISRGAAGLISDGFVPVLIDDLLMEIPNVSTMAILDGFRNLRMSTTPFVGSTGGIIDAIKKAEYNFQGARRTTLATKITQFNRHKPELMLWGEPERREKLREEHHQRCLEYRQWCAEHPDEVERGMREMAQFKVLSAEAGYWSAEQDQDFMSLRLADIQRDDERRGRRQLVADGDTDGDLPD